MICAYCEEGNLEKAIKLWNDMKSNGLLPNSFTCNTLIGGLCKAGEADKGMVLLNEMGLLDFAQTRLLIEYCLMLVLKVVRYYYYNAIINGYCKSSHVNKAFSSYSEMMAKGVSPNVATYNTLLGGLSTASLMHKTKNLVDEMSSFLRPVPIMCLFLILRSGENGSSFRTTERDANERVVANSSTYDILISGWCKLSNREVRRSSKLSYQGEAKKMLREMNEKGFAPSESTVVSISDALAKPGKKGEARRRRGYYDLDDDDTTASAIFKERGVKENEEAELTEKDAFEELKEFAAAIYEWEGKS
ncbi:hypothetical protein GIB67_001949, partial [Kingdonia uniflora]